MMIAFEDRRKYFKYFFDVFGGDGYSLFELDLSI
jgi:hypothetical protein